MIHAVGLVPETLDRWRATAKQCLAAGVRPDSVAWEDNGSATLLFGMALPDKGDVAFTARVPKGFSALVSSVACHRDPLRWSLLYELLWRLTHGEAHLLEVASDPLLHRLIQMHRAVRRASHKMKAFVRFREIESHDDSSMEFVAWFEPAHRVVERTAPFFATRFPSMRWAILTPDGCARWHGSALHLSAGIERHAAPAGTDALEDLWRTYYAGTFNPARLNRRAMRAEMPTGYWKNLPEASLIDTLSRQAPARVARMIAQTLEPPVSLPADLEAVESAAVAPPRDEPGWHPEHDPGWAVARARADAVSTCARLPLRVGGSTVRAGVAGWTDPTLLAEGVFYPSGATSAESRLRYYATSLSMVEVDATYYSMPSEETSRRWVERTPEHFRFDVKAHSLMTGHPTNPARLPRWLSEDLPLRLRAAKNVYTHHFSRDAIDEVWRRFLGAVSPLRHSGKLGAIMLQFPKWFTPTRASARALEQARDRLADWPASVELRHRDWLGERLASRTFALLRSLAYSHVGVDAPPGMESSMPPLMEVTNPELAIIRLHGRRESTWEARNEIVTERYRYLYAKSQLEAWLPSVYHAALDARHVHLIFNNNHANYAATNAVEMHELVCSGAQ